MDSGSVYAVYGLRGDSIELWKSVLSEKLSLVFSLHESSYVGIYYKAIKNINIEFKIMRNFVESSGDWLIESSKEYALILRANFFKVRQGKELDAYNQVAKILETIDGVMLISKSAQ